MFDAPMPSCLLPSRPHAPLLRHHLGMTVAGNLGVAVMVNIGRLHYHEVQAGSGPVATSGGPMGHGAT